MDEWMNGVLHHLCAMRLRGIVKLKKIQKSEKNLDYPDNKSIIFFWKMYNE